MRLGKLRCEAKQLVRHTSSSQQQIDLEMPDEVIGCPLKAMCYKIPSVPVVMLQNTHIFRINTCMQHGPQ